MSEPIVSAADPLAPESSGGKEDPATSPATGVTRERRRSRRSWRRVAYGGAGLLLALGVWQVAALVIADPVTLPSVSQTVRELLHYLTHTYPEAQGKTLVEDALISTGRCDVAALDVTSRVSGL